MGWRARSPRQTAAAEGGGRRERRLEAARASGRAPTPASFPLAVWLAQPPAGPESTQAEHPGVAAQAADAETAARRQRAQDERIGAPSHAPGCGIPFRVSTVAGNGEEGFADGEGAAARFKGPMDVAINTSSTIVVADRNNSRLPKIVGSQATTLAGGAEAGTADGVGPQARFRAPWRLALDPRGRLLVSEFDREDSLRIVEAGLSAPVDTAREGEVGGRNKVGW